MGKFIYLAFFAVILLTSCKDNALYNKSYSFKNNEWKQSVKPSFVFEVKDTNKVYNFIIAIRTTTSYDYSNLWLYLNTKAPNGEKGREPYQMIISNPDGTWYGNKSGSIVENKINFNRRKFPKKGKYVFTVEQGVTEKVLDEVLDITFIVEEVKVSQ
jgi:gliding motility-associated lipoprotein GldH